MRFNQTPLNTAIRLALAVSMAGFVGSALAQETGQPTDAAKTQEAKKQPLQLETVTVTGTRIRSQTITASSPVAEISQEQFKVTGSTRVDDLVNQMPQMSPVFDSFQNNGATGYPTADLRGLGTSRTLVLVDGQRLQPGANFAADLSQIPAALVKRVDILTGGASAVYGADAVAGVVNFVLDDQFEGFQVNAGYSAYQHNNDNSYIQGLEAKRGFNAPNGNSGFDGKSRNIDLIWGSSFADGKGHATSWLSWRQNDSLFQGARDYSACALNATGTACGGSGTAPIPNFYLQDPNGPNGGYAHLDQGTGSWIAGIGNVYNYAPLNYYQRPDNRINYGLSLKYEVNEHFRPFLEFMYTNRSSSIQVAQSGTFFGQTLSLPCNSPLLGTACADVAGPLGLSGVDPVSVYVGKRNTEGGPRYFDQKDNSYRAVTGATGDLGTYWSYNVTGVVGQTTSTTVGTHDLLSDRITSALLGCPAGSFSGCLPYNVWVPGGVTTAAAQALEGTSVLVTSTKLSSVNGYLSGTLPYSLPWADGDSISLVAGTEWRKEQYSFTADSNSQAGNFAG
ncbi:MAG: TonB-dependent receptor plug domain-containing protein, partial [Rhodanobacter sp.]|nr:TonB-dependent receptor plug domain-containing protein [Rhodanobacter sp.]